MVEQLYPNTLEWTLHIEEHLQRYRFASSFVNGGVVVDAACGVGYGSYMLALANADEVIGIDCNKSAVEFAKNAYNNPNLTFKIGNCESLHEHVPLADLVVSFETIEHLLHPESFLRSVSKILKASGIFICSTPNILRHSLSKDNSGINPYHVSEMHFDEFKALVERFFILEKCFYQSETEQYKRHLQTIKAVYGLIDRYNNSIISKLCLLFNNLFRSPKEPLTLPREVERALPGDFVIEQLNKTSDDYKNIIVVCRRK